MNPIFSRYLRTCWLASDFFAGLATLWAFVLLGMGPVALSLHAQGSSNPELEFRQTAQELSSARLSGSEDDEAQMEKAFEYLDTVAISSLNLPAGPDVDGANQRLEKLVSRIPPVGENYRLTKLGGSPAVYAMIINFGLGGPAGIRIYSSSTGHYALSAKIDHYVRKDFIDSDLELVPVSDKKPVFVIVAGRTDDLSTGVFSAWLFDGRGVAALWSSDLLQQSTYEADENGFHLAYCSQPDEDQPSRCLKMSRDLYRFQAGEWKRIETVDVPPPKSPTK